MMNVGWWLRSKLLTLTTPPALQPSQLKGTLELILGRWFFTFGDHELDPLRWEGGIRQTWGSP